MLSSKIITSRDEAGINIYQVVWLCPVSAFGILKCNRFVRWSGFNGLVFYAHNFYEIRKTEITIYHRSIFQNLLLSSLKHICHFWCCRTVYFILSSVYINLSNIHNIKATEGRKHRRQFFTEGNIAVLVPHKRGSIQFKCGSNVSCAR